MAERKKSIQSKEVWNYDRTRKIRAEYYDVNDNLDDSKKVTQNVLKLVDDFVREGRNRSSVFEWLRGISNVEKVCWSLQGMNDRIVPMSLIMKTGEIMRLCNEDRGGNRLSLTSGEPVSYFCSGGIDYWKEENWLVLKDSDISLLPGYEQFKETHIDKEGFKHVSWKDVEHVIWDSISMVDPRDIFLKDGTRLTKVLSGHERTCRFEDDADKYALHLNLDTATDFPCYKEAIERFNKGIKNGDLEFEYSDGPQIPRLFTREYMQKRGYIPNIVRKTEDGRYVIVCRLSDLTEAGQKRFTSKGGKPDDKGNIKMCFNHDILVGEAARHIEMDFVEGKVSVNKVVSEHNLIPKENPDIKYYNEVVSAAAEVVDFDTGGAKPKACFLEDGWKDKFDEWFNKNNPFFGSEANTVDVEDIFEKYPEILEIQKQVLEDERKRKQESQGIAM